MMAQKKRIAALVVAAAFAVGSAGTAGATPVMLAGPDGWNSWTASQLSGGAFWARPSYDGPGGNIGYFVSGTTGFVDPNFYEGSPGGMLPYLGDGTTTFGLLLTDPMQPTDFKHLLSVTAWNDEFGLFDIATGDKYPMFHAWDTRGQTTSFYPVGLYGFYLTNGDGSTWLSTSLDGGRNHFALFQGERNWYLGVEDMTWTTPNPSDWDYNDMVVGWSEPVPEVGTMSMLGLGLMSLGAARRRWRK